MTGAPVYCVTISGSHRHVLGPKEFRAWCGALECGLVANGPPEWASWPLCSRCEQRAGLSSDPGPIEPPTEGVEVITITPATFMPAAWQGHALAIVGGVCGCLRDGAKASADEDPQAWFASHLAAAGVPDYAADFERFWRELVTDEAGNLDVDKIARELFDYRVVMEEVPKAYDELTNGRLSKPNTAAHHVIEAAEDRFADQYADNLLDEIADMEDPISREALITLAESWSADASERRAARWDATA